VIILPAADYTDPGLNLLTPNYASMNNFPTMYGISHSNADMSSDMFMMIANSCSKLL